MVDSSIGELLLSMAVLFGATYLLAGFFQRLRIPAILGALFVAMAARYTPLGKALLSAPLYGHFDFLAQVGAMFLLFYIGTQIDIKKMKTMGSDIVWCTALNTMIPFLLGMAVMFGLGYGPMLAIVIGLTRMPTAEAVVVPILDDFNLIRSRVGALIVGVGTLDDVIEVFLVVIVSIWIGKKAMTINGEPWGLVLPLVLSLVLFVFAVWLSRRWLISWLARWLPSKPQNLIMLSVLVLFGFGGGTEYGHMGMLIGAI